MDTYPSSVARVHPAPAGGTASSGTVPDIRTAIPVPLILVQLGLAKLSVPTLDPLGPLSVSGDADA